MKNQLELRKNWHETKEKLKQKFVKLTDNDLLFVEGKQEDVVKKLQVKLGKSKEDILKIITKL
ncbi:MAG: general stress protein CsbD [Lutibacter sp.]|nr:general stress protein CsbD [Lutibacter sp.]